MLYSKDKKIRALKLSKFDVAERQLLQALHLFFREEDPISIHTLSEAAAQILSDIGGRFGVKSLIRDSDIIREDKKKEWQRYLFKSRNFFKHADRDKNEVHEFNPEINHFTILDAVNMYTTIKKRWVPETLVFVGWFSVKYPGMIREDSEIANFISTTKAKDRTPDPDNMLLLYDMVSMMRKGKYYINNVTLDYGI